MAITYRITEAGDRRVTEDGVYDRITEDSFWIEITKDVLMYAHILQRIVAGRIASISAMQNIREDIEIGVDTLARIVGTVIIAAESFARIVRDRIMGLPIMQQLVGFVSIDMGITKLITGARIMGASVIAALERDREIEITWLKRIVASRVILIDTVLGVEAIFKDEEMRIAIVQVIRGTRDVGIVALKAIVRGRAIASDAWGSVATAAEMGLSVLQRIVAAVTGPIDVIGGAIYNSIDIAVDWLKGIYSDRTVIIWGAWYYVREILHFISYIKRKVSFRSRYK